MTRFSSDMCIICFAPKRFHSQWLFSPPADDTNEEIEISEIGLLYQELFQISLSFREARPEYVCQLCKEQLHKFHKFKLKAWEAHQKVSNELYDNNAVEGHDRSSSNSKDNNVIKVEELAVLDMPTKQTEKYEIQYLEDEGNEVDADNEDAVDLIEIDEIKTELLEESELQDRDDGNIDQSISSSNSTSPLQQSIQHFTRIACPVCSSFFDNQEDFEMHSKDHEIRKRRNMGNNVKRGKFTDAAMRGAIELVIKEGMSLRKAAKEKNVAYQTLARYVGRAKNNEGYMRQTPDYSLNRIFTDEEENALEEYIIKCAKMFYGLSPIEVRKLSFEMGEMKNKTLLPNWKEEKMAGKQWLRRFRSRHPNISLRTAEECSLSRPTSFHRQNVDLFFNNLKEVYTRFENFSCGSRIFNLDETGTTAVQESQKVSAEKGIKEVNKATSSEKGTVVTTCVIVSATGQYIPPVMIFPRKHFETNMTNGAPSGTLGLATPSGWMNPELFLQTMEHFIKQTSSSSDNPSLLIYDNHDSHLSLAVLKKAEENGVTILTIPAHCSNKLQPLDAGVFKPFQIAYNAAVESWMMQHPGQTVSIYNIAACVGCAFQKAVTPSNIISSFKNTGIYPYDATIFTDVDYMPSTVTDQPMISPTGNREQKKNLPTTTQKYRLN